jgi:hypothetical protein
MIEEQILSYKTLFFDIVTPIGYALWPAMNKSLYAARVKICSSGGGQLFHSPYRRFQRIEAEIQLRTQFPSRNQPIRADELIETLFVS